MYDLLIPILTFLAVTALGGALLSARGARRQALQARLFELEQQPSETDTLEGRPRWHRLFHRIGMMVSPKEPSAGLSAELAKAGYHGSSAPLIFLGSKIVLLIAGLVGLAMCLIPIDTLSLPVRLLLIAWGAGVLFMVPNFIVRLRREKRRKEIRSHLPDAIDLLEISVSAGMGLDMAWNSVADEIRGVSTILADEMALTNLEIHLGAARAVAMRHMSDRTGAEEIASLVSVLIQSDRFGTSISDALRTFATTMRELRSQRAEEAAEKMPVKLLFPLVLFIFPAVLIVVAGPAGIEWAKIISGS